jgi:hypothetical protein
MRVKDVPERWCCLDEDHARLYNRKVVRCGCRSLRRITLMAPMSAAQLGRSEIRCDVASLWSDVIATLVPRDSEGRIQFDRIALPPPERPECIVVRDTMCAAWYAELAEYSRFCAERDDLFVAWSDGRAQTFAWRWQLGRNGLKDLCHSHWLWSVGWLKAPELRVGMRMYGESESERRVPSGLANAELQRMGARRLFRARVLEWTWKQIATAEALAGGRKILDENDLKFFADTVRQDVYRWQRALGLHSRLRGRAKPR